MNSVDLPLLERFEDEKSPLILPIFDKSECLHYITSYDFGFRFFAFDWKHIHDPNDCFDLRFTFNKDNQEFWKYIRKEKKSSKIKITISYENDIIDESETLIVVTDFSTKGELEKAVKVYPHVKKTTDFQPLMPIKLICFLNLMLDDHKAYESFVPCIILRSNRNHFFNQILALINKKEAKKFLTLKLKDILELRLDDQVLILRNDDKFVPPIFTVSNKSLFNIKYSTSRVKDSRLPDGEHSEKLMNIIKNTDLGTKTVVRIHVITAPTNSVIQESLDDIDKIVHTYKD